MNLILIQNEIGSGKSVINSKSWNQEKKGVYNWKQPSKKLWELIQKELNPVKL